MSELLKGRKRLNKHNMHDSMLMLPSWGLLMDILLGGQDTWLVRGLHNCYVFIDL